MLTPEEKKMFGCIEISRTGVSFSFFQFKVWGPGGCPQLFVFLVGTANQNEGFPVPDLATIIFRKNPVPFERWRSYPATIFRVVLTFEISSPCTDLLGGDFWWWKLGAMGSPWPCECWNGHVHLGTRFFGPKVRSVLLSNITIWFDS